jgi:hypothetical protein
VLQLSPLKESCPEIRCEGLFKGREACYPVPTSVSALGYLASSIREAKWARQLSDTRSTQKLLSEEFSSLTSMKHRYFGRNPRQYGTSFTVFSLDLDKRSYNWPISAQTTHSVESNEGAVGEVERSDHLSVQIYE